MRFRGVFPSRDVQQEAEFRRLAIETINDFADRNQERLVKLKKIPAIHYQRLSGSVFVEQMFNLSLYIMLIYTSKPKFQPSINELSVFKSINEREEFVRQQYIEYENNLKQFEQSEQQIELFIKDYEQSVDKISSNLSHLRQYGCIDELKEINENFAIKLSKINDNIEKMLCRWNEILSSNENLRSHNQDPSNLVNLSTNFIMNLKDTMKEFEKFVRNDEDSKAKWLQAFQHFSLLNEIVLKVESKLREISSQFAKIEREKKEILSSEFAKQLHNRIENHVQTLLNLDLQLKID